MAERGQGLRFHGGCLLALFVLEDLAADTAHIIVIVAVFRAGRVFGLDLFHVVTLRGNFLLRSQDFIADGAVLALGQTGLGAGGFRSLVDDLAVPLGRNLLLRSQHLIADGAVRSFRQASLGAGRLYPLVGHFGVSKSGDSFCPDRRCLRSLLILERSPAGLTDVIGFVAGLGAGGSYCLHSMNGMSKGGQDFCRQGGLHLALLVQEDLVTGGAGEIGVVAIFDAGGRLGRSLHHAVAQSGQDYAGRICALSAVLIRKVSIAGKAVPVFQVTIFCTSGRFSEDMLRIMNMGRTIVDSGISQRVVTIMFIVNFNFFPLQV